MVRGVAARALDRVVLVETARRQRRSGAQPRQPLAADLAAVEGEQVEQVVEAALLEGQPSVHIGFRQVELRPDEKLPMQPAVVQPDRGGGAGSRPAEAVPGAAGVDQVEPAGPDHLVEQSRQQHRNKTNGEAANIGQSRRSRQASRVSPAARFPPRSADRPRPRPRRGSPAGRCRPPAVARLPPTARRSPSPSPRLPGGGRRAPGAGRAT